MAILIVGTTWTFKMSPLQSCAFLEMKVIRCPEVGARIAVLGVGAGRSALASVVIALGESWLSFPSSLGGTPPGPRSADGARPAGGEGKHPLSKQSIDSGGGPCVWRVKQQGAAIHPQSISGVAVGTAREPRRRARPRDPVVRRAPQPHINLGPLLDEGHRELVSGAGRQEHSTCHYYLLINNTEGGTKNTISTLSDTPDAACLDGRRSE